MALLFETADSSSSSVSYSQVKLLHADRLSLSWKGGTANKATLSTSSICMYFNIAISRIH